MDKNLKKGFYFAFITALISGLAIFFSSLATKVIRDPFVLTTSRNVVVALVLGAIILTVKNRQALKKISKKDWLYLVLVGIIGGSIPFLLFFKGLSMSSPLIGGFIHKTLFIWVSFLAVIFLREKIGKIQWVALAVLLGGNFLLGAFNNFKFGKPELLILVATLFWAVEYIIAKKILIRVSPQIVAWGRMFFGAVALVFYLIFTQKISALFELNLTQIFWVVFGALLLLGYVSFWYRALKLCPASVVTCILVLGSPISTLLTGLFISHKYSFEQILGIIIISLGLVVFLVFNPKKETKQAKLLNLVNYGS